MYTLARLFTLLILCFLGGMHLPAAADTPTQTACFAAPEAGVWKARHSRNLTTAIVTANCDGSELTMTLWGSCHPRDCYLGQRKAKRAGSWKYNPTGAGREFLFEPFKPNGNTKYTVFATRLDDEAYAGMQVLHLKVSQSGKTNKSFNVNFYKVRHDLDVNAMETRQRGHDRLGSDLPGMPIVMNNTTCKGDCAPAFCAKLCAVNEQCKSWSYVAPGLQRKEATCWLKHQAPVAVANECCTTGALGK